MVSYEDPETGRKIKIGLFDAFTAGSRTIRTGNGRRRSEDSKADTVVMTPAESSPERQSEPAKAEAKDDKKEEKKKDKGKEKKDASPEKKQKNGKKFTDDEDAILIEMKAEKEDWEIIASVLEKSKAEVIARYGQILKAEKAAVKAKEKEEEEAAKAAAAAAAAAEKSKPDIQVPTGLEPDHLEYAIDPPDDVDLMAAQKIMKEVEGHDLTATEVMGILRLYDVYEHQLWIKLASDLFDMSGKRISPALLQDVLRENKLIK